MKNILLSCTLLSMSLKVVCEDSISAPAADRVPVCIQIGITAEECEDCSSTELVIDWIKRAPKVIDALTKGASENVKICDDRLETRGQKAEGTFTINNLDSNIVVLGVTMEITEAYHEEPSAALDASLATLDSNGNSTPKDSSDPFTKCINKLHASYNQDKKELTNVTHSTCTMTMSRAMLLARVAQATS